MDVLGNICLHEDYFNLVIEKILAIFYANKEILNSKMHIVIKKLCNILNPEKVYMAVAEKLNGVEDLGYVSSVVQTLDIILLTDDVKKKNFILN
jgi:vacuole morphology and inheritance protein 14